MYRNIRKEKGITLIALVVTIIVLLILASISISMALGNGGLIERAKDAKGAYANATNKEINSLDNMLAEMNEMIEETIGPERLVINKDTVPSTDHSEIEEAEEDGRIIGKDELGNQVVVPDGFKVASDSGPTVKEGIVIEDEEGNQYVWVPVSNINHDGSNKIKVDSTDEEGVEITLGRYTFDKNTGEVLLTEGSYQYASTYETPVAFAGRSPHSAYTKCFQELPIYRESNYTSGKDGTNTTARNLRGFVESVRDNKGYYIARYEASYRPNGKAGSIVTNSKRTNSSTDLTEGMLWNFIKQGEAAVACQNLYTTINSDLMNSYAWDTAIIYIQAMSEENANYANTSTNIGTINNTGTQGDEKCKIFDMAGNGWEWTTEYSSDKNAKSYACVFRAGYFNFSNMCTCYRGQAEVNYAYEKNCFRSTLYL